MTRLADAYEEQAAAFARLADTTAQVAHELRGIESPVARAGVVSGVEGATDTPRPSSAPDSLSTVLSQCPDHQVAWTVKDGGIGRNGQPYPAFWRCNERTDGEYCKKRPTPAWAKSHPIETVAA